MLVSIYPSSKHILKSIESQFALQQDHWNDFGFETLYHLYYDTPGEEATFIGGVKILRRGQTEADGLQIEEPFDVLDERFCSVGTSLDYYQLLNTLPDEIRTKIVRALRDVAAHPELRASFSQEPGWRTSLFRNNSDWRRFLDDAYALYFNPALTEYRLRIVAEALLEVLYDTELELAGPLDDGYTRGTATFGRQRNALIQLCNGGQYPWLKLTHAGMDVTFEIDGVPCRFFSDDPANPRKPGFFRRNDCDQLFDIEVDAP